MLRFGYLGGKMLFIRLLFVVVMLVACVPHAEANIALDKVVLRFMPGQRPVQNVEVTNSGDKVMRVTGKVIEELNPGQPGKAKEVETRELALAPRSFELQPGAKRMVRLVLRRPPEEREKIFRVRFTPDKAGEVIEQSGGSGVSLNIGVVATMGVLVMAAPKVAKPDLSFERGDGKIVFTNKGNVTAQLQREDFCLDTKRENCVALLGKRVYPGATWTMELDEALKGREFRQTVYMNGEYATLVFPVK